MAWHGVQQAFAVRDLPNRIEIEWDGSFELSGPFFVVQSEHPDVGSRHIRGYPVERLRRLLEDVRTADKRIEDIFGREDAVPLTPDIITQLVRGGWEDDRLRAAARQGALYSPSRDTVLFPPVGNI